MPVRTIRSHGVATMSFRSGGVAAASRRRAAGCSAMSFSKGGVSVMVSGSFRAASESWGGLRELLDGALRDASGEVALRGDEEDQHRQHEQRGRSKEEVVVREVLTLVLLQTKRECAQRFVVQEDQRSDERGPGAQGRHDCDGDQYWFGHGQHDLYEQSEGAGAVHLRRLDEFVRELAEELPQQEDREGGAEGGGKELADEWRTDKRSQGADHAELSDDQVEGHHDCREGQHHAEEHHAERGVASSPAQDAERVGGWNACKERSCDAEDGDDDAVPEIGPEVDVVDRVCEVSEVKAARK